LFEESLRTNTHVKGNADIGDILEGKVFKHSRTGMAAVVNPGTDRNWTGHPFVQSSWYSFGRFAWDHKLTAETIAEEWSRMTFSNDKVALDLLKKIMMVSREAGVNYRDPLGLTHLYSQGDHYGPAPWTEDMPRADWNAVYYHRADANGIGFNRTKTGSNAIAQYPKTLADIYGDLNQVPEDLILWFHHVSWDHKMKSGRTMWEELVHKYYEGVDQVRQMQKEWDQLEGKVDADRFAHVKALLKIQESEAVRWRDSCVVYFQSISKKPIPDGLEKPAHDLEYYKMLARILYVPDPWHPAGNSRKLK
jgi:alpha-glucuronidase